MAENPTRTSSPRQVVRGASVTFEELFVEPDGTPIPSDDGSRYPAVSIVAPDQTVMATGVASSLGDGRFRYQWFAPADADLSSPDVPWRINWTFVTPTQRQIERESNFHLLDTVEGDSTERSYTYITMLGAPERLIARYFTEQDEVMVVLTDSNMNVLETYSGPSITTVHEGGTVVYYVDTTPAESSGIYNVIWQTRQTRISPKQLTVQQLRVPEPLFWTFQPALRMLLDKMQKKTGQIQSYSDSDLYEYSLRGVGLVNQYNPVTSWSLSAFPTSMGFEEFILMASAWWGLNAQYLAEGETMFSFSGQSVTLDVDRTSVYESAMARLKEHIDSQLSKAKTTWMRRQSPGVNMGRPFNFGLANSVVRVSQSTGAGVGPSLMSVFGNLGLV